MTDTQELTAGEAGGALVRSGGVPATTHPVIETRDPRTGEVIGTVPDCSAAEVAAAVERARAAQKAWGGLPFAERTKHLLAVRDLLLDPRSSCSTSSCARPASSATRRCSPS